MCLNLKIVTHSHVVITSHWGKMTGRLSVNDLERIPTIKKQYAIKTYCIVHDFFGKNYKAILKFRSFTCNM